MKNFLVKKKNVTNLKTILHFNGKIHNPSN